MLRRPWSLAFAWFYAVSFVVEICLPFELTTAYVEPSLNCSFSIRSSIERFHRNKRLHQVSTKLRERYSSPQESRAVVEFESNTYRPIEQFNSQLREFSSKLTGGDHKSYHYDGTTNQWLKLEKGKCSVPKVSDGDSKHELQEELFGDEICDFIKRPAGEGPTKHMIGAAKLLLLLKHLWPKFVADEKNRIIRGVEVTIYRVKLKPSEDEGCPGFHLAAAYRRSRSARPQRPETELPSHLELGFGDTLLIVSFYDFKLLDNLRSLEQIRSKSTVSYRDKLAFVFPLEAGCATALVNANRQQQQQDNRERGFLQRAGSSVSKVWFRAKIRDNLSAKIKETNMIFAFDLGAKLLRKDSIQQDFVENRQILSTTVYDFERNKKYHSFTRTEPNRMTILKPIKLDQGLTFGTGCFVSQITTTTGSNNNKRISNNQLIKFINFERLVLMGRVKSVSGIGGGGAKVYVDDGPDRLPFWLAPSVVLKRGIHDNDDEVATMSPNVTKLDSYELDLNSKSGQVMLIYYFADNDDKQDLQADDEVNGERIQMKYGEFSTSSSSSAIQLGQLLRLDIFVKDSVRDILIMSQTMEFSEFSWNQLGAISSGRKTVNPFALCRICSTSSSLSASASWASESESGGAKSLLNKLDLAIVLVPESRLLSKEDSKIVERLLSNQIARNEMIIEVLESEFRLPKVYVDQVSSNLLLSIDNSSGRELQATFNMPSIKFNVRLANLKQNDQVKQHVYWVSLGLGQFLDKRQLRRSEVLTLEECLWSAHHYSKLIGEEVLFSYKQNVACGVNSRAQECLIDRLYKWRDLQHHEMKIANTSKIRSLNYFPYEFGEYPMYKVTYTKSYNHDDARLRTSLLLISKPMSQIGRRITLPILDDKALEMQFILKYSSVSGSISEFENLAPTATAEESAATMKSPIIIDRVAWHRSKGDDKSLVKSASSAITTATSFNSLMNLDGLKSKTTKRDSNATDDRQPLMTLSLCRSICLLDIECKSYSYCEASIAGLQSNNKADDCKFSLIDISFGQITELIREQVSNKPTTTSFKQEQRNQRTAGGRQAPFRRISIELGDKKKKTEVSIRMNGRCAIYSKSYSDLFAKSPSKEIAPIELVHQQQVVEDVNDCARLCFEKNLFYSKGLIEHKLNLTIVENEIKELKQQAGSISEQKLESLFDWHTRNLKSLCVYFYYSAGQAADVSRATTNHSCLLSTDLSFPIAGQQHPHQQGGSSANRMMDLHKLIYAKMFERMSGFRLAATIARESDAAPLVGAEAVDESASESFKLLLISHQIGLNRQVQVNLDDIEYCARACTLQTHGPRPACSSFDFVYERRRGSDQSTGQGHKYCLLNSQSLNDLNRQRTKGNNNGNSTTNLQNLLVFAENDDQFWHFEPRDSLLRYDENTSVGMSETNQDELDKVWYEFLDKNLVTLDQNFVQQRNAFKRISLLAMLTALGVASGLLFGVKLARVLVQQTKDESEEANFMSRLVHRLSGVSISSRLQDGEVWM